MRKICVGDKVIYRYRDSVRKGKVVYIFKAFSIPKTKKIIKYYGYDIINPLYSRVFGPAKDNRVVLKMSKTNYIVCPMTRNAPFTLELITNKGAKQ